jgi:antirestriction protein
MTTTLDRPQIYVADLAAYNSGYLHGKWIDATLTAEEIESAVKEIMLCSPVEDAEEWAIHDYQNFDGLRIEEYTGFEDVSELANMIVNSDYPEGLIAEVYNNFNGDLNVEEIIEYMEENYQGKFDSLGHWAQQYLEETCGLEGVPKHLLGYIDYDGYGRDEDINGSIFTVELTFGEVHVFSNR